MNLTKTQIDSAKNVKCEKCNSQLFHQVYAIKHISGLLMQDGKDTLIPVPAFACDVCKHINEMFTKDLGLEK